MCDVWRTALGKEFTDNLSGRYQPPKAFLGHPNQTNKSRGMCVEEETATDLERGTCNR